MVRSSPIFVPLEQLPEAPGLRMDAEREGLHEEDARATRGLHDDPRARRIHRDRLLAEDVLAGRGGGHGQLDMRAVRRRDVDDLDVRVVEQRRVRSVGALDAELVGERLGRAVVTAADRDDAPGGGGCHRPREGPGDAPGAEDAPPRSIAHRSLHPAADPDPSPLPACPDPIRITGRPPARPPSRPGPGTPGPSAAATATLPMIVKVVAPEQAGMLAAVHADHERHGSISLHGWTSRMAANRSGLRPGRTSDRGLIP